TRLIQEPTRSKGRCLLTPDEPTRRWTDCRRLSSWTRIMGSFISLLRALISRKGCTAKPSLKRVGRKNFPPVVPTRQHCSVTHWPNPANEQKREPCSKNC